MGWGDNTKSGNSTPRRQLSVPSLSLDRLRDFEEEEFGAADPSQAGTPGLLETGKQLRRTLSFKSIREADAKWIKNRVWRSQHSSSPRKRPQDLDQLVAYAIRGGSRSFFLAFAARSGFNVLLVLLSRLRKRPTALKRLLLHAIFGETPIRFSLMFGLFSFIYRFAYNGLRLWNPGSRGPGREERWHAALAGAMASLSLLADRPSARSATASQVFVRALQGVYHRLAKEGLHIPHGDVILFGLACGQIMYSWVASPALLDKSYFAWITSASRMPTPLAPGQMARYRGQPLDLGLIPKLLNCGRGVHPENALAVKNYIDRAKRLGDYGPPFLPCALNHPQTTSCLVHILRDIFPSVTRWVLPVYIPLTFLPPLLFKYSTVKRNPLHYLTRSITGTLASSSFLGAFVLIYQGQMCLQRKIYYSLLSQNKPTLAKAAAHRWWGWLFGFFTCLSLFVENKKRREELAVYVLPKAMGSFWKGLEFKGRFKIPNGELLLNVIGVALLTDTWRHHRQALSGLVRTLLWQTLGN